MNGSATVYAECLRLEVRVSLGLPSDVSNLEHFLLKAIYEGAATVPQLVAVLGVSPRLLVDCLGDLWRQGHVMLDFESPHEPVALSTPVIELIQSGGLETLASGYKSTESRVVLLDTLTGRVLPESARQAPRVPRLRVPRRPSDFAREDVTSTQLLRALADDARRQLNREGVATRTTRRQPMRVLNAYLAPEFVSLAQGTRTVPLVVSVTADDQRGLLVEVVDPMLSEAERARASRRLQELVDEQPDSAFVAALKDNLALLPPTEAKRLADTIPDLQSLCDALVDAPPGTRQSAHDRTAQAVEAVRSQVAFAREQAAQLRVLVGDEHTEAIAELIDHARHQVVIANPRITEPGLNRILPNLERALARGVQVVLLWGLGLDDQLPDAVRNALDNLQRGAGPDRRILVKTQVSSRLHAKVVVADNTKSLVTSRNFLTSGSLLDVGIVAEGSPAEPPGDLRVGVDQPRRAVCASATDLLDWAYQMFPDHDVAKAILRHPSSFHAAKQPPSAPVAGARYNPLVEKEAPGGPRVQLWAACWRRAADDLAAEAAALAPTAALVRDAEHPRVLQRAVDTATHRLIIASDQLSASILDADLRGRLCAAMSRGADVTLIYGRLATQDPDGAQEAVWNLEREAAAVSDAGRGNLTVRQVERSHAKGVLADDEAVVGSFNFLSFPGHYSGRGRWRDRGEISLHVQDPGTCDRLAAVWGAGPAKRSPAPLDSVPTAELATISAGHLERAAEVMDALLEGTNVGVRLLELLAGGDDEIPVLDALAASAATTEDLTRAAAAMLCQGQVTPGNPWWGWLVGQLWSVGDLAAAAAMRPVIDDAQFRPRLALTTATAAWLSGRCGVELSESALDENLTTSEQAALSIMGIVDLLEHGDHATREALALLTPAEGALSELWTVATEFYDATGRPLPFADLAAIARQTAGVATSENHWERVHQTLDRLQTYNTGFISGASTIKYAFRSGGDLHALNQIANRRDAAAVSSWLTGLFSRDPGELTDHLSAGAGAKPIIGSRREPFVARVSAVLASAQAVAETAVRDRTAQVKDPHVLRAMNALPQVRGRLPAVIDVLTGPERAVALAAMRRLAELMGEANP